MRIPGWLLLVGLVGVVVLTAVLSVVSYTVAREFAIRAGEAGVQFVSEQQIAQAAAATPTPFPTAQPLVAPTTAPGETPQATAALPTPTYDPASGIADWPDPRRFTVLLLGIDQRSALKEDGPFRTDTMIVVSVDPVRKTAGVLSIPRDLWVNIPGYTQGRINTANSLGDANAYPGGGPALAAETIRQNLGIPVDKYLLINFDVFTKLVETIAPDGVEICVKEVIDDPYYPDAGNGFIHVHFDPGCQVLDAEKLLQYARTRHTEKSDFDRAARQQEVLRALRDKVLNVGGITNFVGRAPQLWDELTGNFKTNLSLDEILSLGILMQDIPRDNIRFGQIDNLYVTFSKTNTGDDVLIPRSNAIRLLVQQVFNPESDLALAELRSRAEAENATIVVFNNSDVTGLASQTRDWLEGRGVQVKTVGNVPTPSNADTAIQVYTGKIWTGKYLAALLGLPPERVQPGADGITADDVAILVGADIQSKLGAQQ